MNKKMQFAINRRVVLDGLARRAAERAAAEKEANLEVFEASMIRKCNDHFMSASLQKRMDEDVRTCRDRCMSNISGRAEARERKQRQRKDAALGCLSFFAFAVVTFWLTTWTYLPIWAAVTLVAGGALFPAAHIAMVYGLLTPEVSA